ncbi:RNA polymerase sigma factor [Alkaliphilus crotonatoxidans]
MSQIEKLYQQYSQDLFNYIMSLTHHPTLSEDLVSETFLTAIGALPTFKGESSIKTWLFGIARNRWLRHLKRQRPTVEFNDLLSIYVLDSVEESMINLETLNRIKEILDQRDERTRTIVYMRAEGYAYSVIAAKAGVTESSARVIDFRTKKWLRSVLRKEELL